MNCAKYFCDLCKLLYIKWLYKGVYTTSLHEHFTWFSNVMTLHDTFFPKVLLEEFPWVRNYAKVSLRNFCEHELLQRFSMKESLEQSSLTNHVTISHKDIYVKDYLCKEIFSNKFHERHYLMELVINNIIFPWFRPPMVPLNIHTHIVLQWRQRGHTMDLRTYRAVEKFNVEF